MIICEKKSTLGNSWRLELNDDDEFILTGTNADGTPVKPLVINSLGASSFVYGDKELSEAIANDGALGARYVVSRREEAKNDGAPKRWLTTEEERALRRTWKEKTSKEFNAEGRDLSAVVCDYLYYLASILEDSYKPSYDDGRKPTTEDDAAAVMLAWAGSICGKELAKKYPDYSNNLNNFALFIYDACQFYATSYKRWPRDFANLTADEKRDVLNRDNFSSDLIQAEYKRRWDNLSEELESVEFLENLVDTEDGLKVDAELVEA